MLHVDTVAGMNMAEDMELQLRQTGNRRPQVRAALVAVSIISVADPGRRTMGHEYIYIFRYQVPVRSNFRSSRSIKSPITETRRNWTPPKLHAADLGTGVLQINQTRHVLHLLGEKRRLFLQIKFMIAADENFSRMREGRQPIDENIHLVRLAHLSKITGMNQDVAGRDFQVAVATVGIGNANDVHGAKGNAEEPSQSCSAPRKTCLPVVVSSTQ